MSDMRSQWVVPGARLWEEALSQVGHDFYHLPSYLQLCAQQECGQPFAFYAEAGDYRFFLPLILRSLPESGVDIGYDVTCPYGYAGPLVYNVQSKLSSSPEIKYCSSGADVLCGFQSDLKLEAKSRAGSERAEFIARAALRLRSQLAEWGVVSAFFRLHPLLGGDCSALCAAGDLVPNGETVYIDLSLPDEVIWQHTRSGHRSEINQSWRRGFEAEMLSLESAAERDTHLRTFCQFYAETMERVGATDAYRFSYDYFLALKQALGNRLSLCQVRIGGELACAALFVETSGIVQYHLSGVGDAFLGAHPTKLMLDYARRWAKARGNRYLHLGGGLGGRSDSLFAFKSGFARTTAPFQTWRLVVDPIRYGQLVTDWEARAGESAMATDTFFPAYRRPLPVPLEVAER